MVANKSPFEIRLDVLKMAKEMLEAETSIKQAAYVATINSMSSNACIADMQQYMATHAPKAYTESDVIARASNLYSFITEKK
jgi:hypothetical protein